MSSRKTPEQRLRAKVDINDDGCWVFNGNSRGKKYGSFWLEGREQYAHRASYQIFLGPIPEDGFIHHRCANKMCVNPDHLQCTTWNNNYAEMLGRQALIKRIRKLEAAIKELGGVS
jgi:hypothetical protein